MKKRKRNNVSNLLIIVVIVVGLCIMLYPKVSNYINSLHQSKTITTYSEKVERIDPEEYERILKEAQEYNENLFQNSNLYQLTKEEKEKYLHCLNLDGKGMMGYIEIPSIHVKIPIYHGTEKSVLQVAVGHLEGTSLPVGGINSHCVLSGHRGLPQAKLFTDLDKLSEGDRFTIQVMDEVMTYEVDQIATIDPQDHEYLQIEKGKDYCTLVTCTPYGINTHRLLVRGHRIENEKNENDLQKPRNAKSTRILLYVFPLIACNIAIWVLVRRRHFRRKVRGGKRK